MIKLRNETSIDLRDGYVETGSRYIKKETEKSFHQKCEGHLKFFRSQLKKIKADFDLIEILVTFMESYINMVEGQLRVRKEKYEV